MTHPDYSHESRKRIERLERVVVQLIGNHHWLTKGLAEALVKELLADVDGTE